MPDVFIGLKEAAEFEGVKYNTLVQRIKRSPNQYKTRTQPQENGGREQVLVSVDSLTAKGRKAWRAAQKIDGRDVVIEKRTESAPWCVGVDLNHYTEQHKKAFYEAVELAARVQDFIDYDGPDRTAYAHGLELAQDAPAQAIEKGLDGAKATLERKPVQKVDLTSGGGKKEGSESGGSGEGSSGKQVIIQKLLIPVDLKKIKDLEQLLAMLKEVEDYAEANGSEEPADDQDAEPAPA